MCREPLCFVTAKGAPWGALYFLKPGPGTRRAAPSLSTARSAGPFKCANPSEAGAGRSRSVCKSLTQKEACDETDRCFDDHRPAGEHCRAGPGLQDGRPGARRKRALDDGPERRPTRQEVGPPQEEEVAQGCDGQDRKRHEEVRDEAIGPDGP